MFRKIFKLPYLIAGFTVVALFLVLFQIEDKNLNAKGNEGGVLVTGSGTIVTATVRTQTIINDCVALATRSGTSTFSGFITGTGENRNAAVADSTTKEHIPPIVPWTFPCGNPVQAVVSGTVTLEDATVTDQDGNTWTGDLELELKGMAEGNSTDPTGARTRIHYTVNGLSGQLAAAHGELLVVGSTFTVGTASLATNTYYAQLVLPGN